MKKTIFFIFIALFLSVGAVKAQKFTGKIGELSPTAKERSLNSSCMNDLKNSEVPQTFRCSFPVPVHALGTTAIFEDLEIDGSITTFIFVLDPSLAHEQLRCHR